MAFKNAFSNLSFRLQSLSVFAIICVQLALASETQEPTNNRPQCATCNLETFEAFKQLRQQQILNDLLKKLDLTAKPNVTIDYDNLPPIGRSNPKIKALIEQTIREKKRSRRSLSYMGERNNGEYLPHLYETETDVTPQLSYVMAERAPWPLEDTLDIAIFNMGQSIRKKYVHKANLHVFLRRPNVLHHLNQAAVRIDVYERFINGTIGEKIATKFELLHGSKAVFPVTIPLDGLDVQTWVQSRVEEQPEPFIGLYVEALYDEDENLAFHPRDRYPDNMFLELELFDMPSRVRRNANAPQVCQAGHNNSKCCLYDLMIDFEKIGWEFVIAPKRYNAYVCLGNCQATPTSTPLVSTHSSVTARTMSDLMQCCHPKDYTGVTIVYVTESNQIWVKEVPGMVARKCGCS